MRIEVEHGPAFAMATVHLDTSETVVAESGAMMSMDAHIQLETGAAKKEQGLMGGLLSGLKRMVAGESFFQNRFTAQGKPGTVCLAPTHAGDVVTHTLSGASMYLQSSAYLCSAPEITLDTKWGGAKTFFGGEGMVMLKATGTGPIAFNSFGGIKEIAVDGDFIVDTGHIVAFEDTVSFKVTRFGGGWKAFIFGGEGLVCKFSGQGRVWIQTRNPSSFGQAVGALLPMRKS